MYNASIIMLNSDTQKVITSELRKKSEDVSLLAELLVKTGCTAHPLSKKRVREMRTFIEQNIQFLPTELISRLENHMESLDDEDYFFTGQRSDNHNNPLSKRSYESLLLNTGNTLGIRNLSVKALTRSFYYGYLRDHNYDFDKLKGHMRTRGRYVYDLDYFLVYCGISENEYEMDRLKHFNRAF